ncbi:DUF983 domain-containing protein [Parapedobacter indicus]|uniref:DUF983 domain-containing protein n=1 Tax=Parapedobacter indicus TaxID=1477437 RepID=A0A1I3SJZ4_9SPHI|nr:DUF983 domain-containing protein [Parapedobacter indicus]PPK99812.1 uncharacterized protein DUF983 [Parapedobacter indicus]SFJ57971.1 Protein of unknown function [Parapedobacter indicus]
MAITHTPKVKAMMASKCPKCRVGKMFVGSTYGFRRQRMNDICPYCGFRFEIEPGYFYAAMYVSYGLSVVQVVAAGLLTYELTKSESPWVYLAVLMGIILIFAPFNFRYSRLILLYYLTPKVKYNPKYEDHPYDEA